MAENKENKAKTETPVSTPKREVPKEPELSKEYFLNNDSHKMDVDVLYAILDDDKKYTLSKVREMYEEAMKREVD